MISAERWESAIARYVLEMVEEWMWMCERMPRTLAWQGLQDRIWSDMERVDLLLKREFEGAEAAGR